MCARRRSHFLLLRQKKVTKEKVAPLAASLRFAAGSLRCSWAGWGALLLPTFLVRARKVGRPPRRTAGQPRFTHRDPRPDLILVTRGGGSKEDLWVFNSERIARAAAACRRPVVSAVGHEIDTSILDYVADLRAPTPSAAAELCVPDQGDVRQKIFILQQNIQKNIQNRCNLCYNRFNQLATAQLLQRQHQQLNRRGQELAFAQAAVRQAAQRHVQDARRSLQSAAAVAESLSPYAVLARGYALPEQNGTPCAVETLRPGDAVTLCGARAAAECRVEAVHTLEQKTGE